MSVSVIRGTTPGGSLKTIAVTEEGLLRVSGSGGTGGGGIGGDASAENQSIEINRLEQIRDRLPSINGKLAVEVSGSSISVTNFPATTAIAGSVSVTNFPATQPISGSVGVNNFPTSFAISNFPSVQPISGSISISNFPATQPISATALPLPSGAATDTVVAAIRDRLPSTLAAGRLVVDGSGVTQPVSGSISVLNFPATQPVSGTVGINNFPATQPISATALPLPTGAATEATTALIPPRLGNTTDAVATNDVGSFSLIALFKRLLTKLPSVLSNDRLKVESIQVSQARTTNFINTSTTGTIAAGSNAVAVANIGNAAGTVKGVSLPAGASINWSANGNNILDAIAYSATGTTFLITTITPVSEA